MEAFCPYIQNWDYNLPPSRSYCAVRMKLCKQRNDLCKLSSRMQMFVIRQYHTALCSNHIADLWQLHLQFNSELFAILLAISLQEYKDN